MKNQYKSAIAILFFCGAISAQQIEIETSPDMSETPGTVPKKEFQMENRFLYEATDDHDSNILKPYTYWKLGLTDVLELNARADFEYDRTNTSKSSGLLPVLVGLKARLWYEHGFLPDAALLTQIKVPSFSSDDYHAQYIAPQITLLLRKTITNSVKIAYNFGAEWMNDSPEPRYMYSASPRIKLGKKLDTFVEVYGYLYEHNRPEHWLDAGLMFQPIKKIQLEISAGYEITDNVVFNKYFGLAGFAFKI